MDKFVFCTKEKKDGLKGFFHKYKKIYGNGRIFLFVMLIFLLIFFVGIYLYNVNLASTRGYFLRQAENAYNAINFNFEILKTQLIQLEKQNWENLHVYRFSQKTVQTKIQTVYVPKADRFVFESKK